MLPADMLAADMVPVPAIGVMEKGTDAVVTATPM